MNNIDANTQTILLLTAYFSKADKGSDKPLTPTEWGRFALWLKNKKLTPADLQSKNLNDILEDWSDKTVTFDRLQKLLDRGHALALAIEKWQRAGIWVITRSDANYPKRLKLRLKTDSPPLLFGVGNARLLNSGGIAVIGSRNTSEQDLNYSLNLGKKIATSGFNLVSGGARGVDETAMTGALQVDGTVVGVLADSLLQAATSQKWRQSLLKNDLVLVSPFYPEAGFNAGNAMARNKYIYCLSDAAVVVHSGTKGGTWSGALENIRKCWVPIYVKQTNDLEAGNQQIVEQGGSWCSEDVEKVDIANLISGSVNKASKPQESNLFTFSSANEETTQDNSLQDHIPEAEKTNTDQTKNNELPLDVSGAQQAETIENSHDIGFYELFLKKIELLCKSKPLGEDSIAETLELNKSQTHIWISKAIDGGLLKKLNRPVRYEWVGFLDPSKKQ